MWKGDYSKDRAIWCRRFVSKRLRSPKGILPKPSFPLLLILARFRATGISLLVCYGCWRFYEHNVLNPLAASLMEAVGNLPPEALQEEVEPFFIPFPGTTKEIKPKAYRGSDPEWQEFVKFSKDQDLGKRVRGRWLQILGQFQR
jgi:hypothetical protein